MMLYPVVYVDLDQSGTFTSTEDISGDVIGLTWQRGSEPYQEGALAGTATVLLNDDCGNYCPDSTTSKFGAGVFNVGFEVKINVNYQTTTYAAFRGRINKLTPDLGVKGEQTASLFCVDLMEEFSHPRISYPIDTPTLGEIVANVVGAPIGGVTVSILDYIWDLAGVGGSTTRRQIAEPGHDIDSWRIYKESPVEQFKKLLIHEGPGSEIYVNSSGTLTWHSSTHRNGAVATSTFDNELHDWEYSWSQRNLLNAAEVTTHPAGELSTLGTVLGTVGIEGASASSGSTLLRIVTLPGNIGVTATVPVGGKDGAGQFAIVSTVDNSTNTALQCGITAVIYGTQTMELRFTSGDTDAWRLAPPEGSADNNITARVTGTHFTPDNFVSTYSNATSITKYGRRLVTRDLTYQQSALRGSSMAAQLVDRYGLPLPDYSRATYIGSDTISIPRVLTLDLGDMIEVTVSRLGVLSQNYFITAGEWTLNPDGVTVKAVWSLEKA